jgi:K(+)-stimulated pyrophosphate-energized sodium pump
MSISIPGIRSILGCFLASFLGFIPRLTTSSRSPHHFSPRSISSLIALLSFFTASSVFASEKDLILPDLSSVSFLGILGIAGNHLLMAGLAVCVFGLAFGLVIFNQLKNLPVHDSMREISELIYETCKTYLVTQGKFILMLEVLIGSIMIIYFGVLEHNPANQVIIILLFSLVGIAGSYGVAWFGIRVNTLRNSRLLSRARRQAVPCYAIPLKAGMSIGMLLISVELVIMLFILLFIPSDYAGSCFIGFAIGESLGASALRIAGGIFTKIADIGADLMKSFRIKEDDACNPGDADCTDNAGDSSVPALTDSRRSETGVALISSFCWQSIRATKYSSGLDLHDAHRHGARFGILLLAE